VEPKEGEILSHTISPRLPTATFGFDATAVANPNAAMLNNEVNTPPKDQLVDVQEFASLGSRKYQHKVSLFSPTKQINENPPAKRLQSFELEESKPVLKLMKSLSLDSESENSSQGVGGSGDYCDSPINLGSKKKKRLQKVLEGEQTYSPFVNPQAYQKISADDLRLGSPQTPEVHFQKRIMDTGPGSVENYHKNSSPDAKSTQGPQIFDNESFDN
jgi:hypothetical protein